MKNTIVILFFLIFFCKENVKKSEPIFTSIPHNNLTLNDFMGSWYEVNNLESELANPRKYNYVEGYTSSGSLGKFKIWQDKRGFQLEMHLPLQADSYFPRSRYEIEGNEIRIFYTILDTKEEIEVVHIRKVENKLCILALFEETASERSYANYNCSVFFIKPAQDPFPGDWNSARHKLHFYTKTYPKIGIGGQSEFDSEALDK
ncbi:hypothetical protein [Leptospira idonii]|uniref:Lipocalin n=1 Tax=Leptospira idonii TaxID=1193500 RepID=A0A4R9LYA4_9LEPT|nr:hypothetical protein [Leptospira idonii]TGN17511.1 hypothetical protein EHS15_16970 [Leptospira idonii]